jgi:hypothetical protein
LCAKNGIVINKNKFVFCQNTVEFAGLTITPHGISPSPKLLASIKDFPSPKNLTDARSWFGLVNQTAWAYSISPIMQPFRELVKKNSKFTWDEHLEEIFKHSKNILIGKVEEGIRSFDVNRRTCIQTDLSKDGIGYLLLQQYCDCALDNVCCPEGWKLVFAGSRFATPTESRYSPTEGEALAVAWGLENARMFILGCKELFVITDHKPFLGILKDRDLSSIPNPRICSLKERTFRYQFKIQHCPGKWNRGSDAISRNPYNPTSSINDPIRQNATSEDCKMAELREEYMNAAGYDIVHQINDINGATVHGIHDDTAITLEEIRKEYEADDKYRNLVDTIERGFPEKRNDTDSNLREYWEVRNRLSSKDKIVFLDKRIVIPSSLRKQILDILNPV